MRHIADSNKGVRLLASRIVVTTRPDTKRDIRSTPRHWHGSEWSETNSACLQKLGCLPAELDRKAIRNWALDGRPLLVSDQEFDESHQLALRLDAWKNG